MTNSKQIAGLVGPTMIALAVTEVLNLHIWAVNIPPVTYLNGTILFVVGLAIVRSHNFWRGWPVLVTLTGWVLILGGLYRMFAPDGPQAPAVPVAYAGFAAMCLLGIFLSFKAYLSKSE